MGTTPSSLVPLPTSRAVALAATALVRASSALSTASSSASWASLPCDACEGMEVHDPLGSCFLQLTGEWFTQHHPY